MALFSKTQPNEPNKLLGGGEMVIRAGLKARVTKRENLINLSRSLEVPQDALLDFAAGESNMNAEALSVIAAFLWPNSSYNEASDKLISGGKEATPMAAAGYPPRTTSSYPPGATHVGAPPPQSEGFVEPSKFKRPDGWL
jgi:hypothetical protein